MTCRPSGSAPPRRRSSNARLQAQLVDDLLDVSRIVTGKLSLEGRPTLLGPVLADALEVVRGSAEARGIHVEVDVPPEPVTIIGDPMRMQQVLVNLLANAVKFTPRGGRVVLSLRHGDGVVHIRVRDTGQGIDARTLPYIFDRFRQGSSGYARSAGGLGLGLSIARHLVEAQGGTIAAESAGPGHGSTFTVSLPIAEAKAPIVSAFSRGRSAAPSLAGARVLVVEDDVDGRSFFIEVLMLRQAEVHGASSVDEAIAVAAAVPIDVVVTDLGLPGADGYELLRRLDELARDVGARRPPVVALTAYAGAAERERALAAGFNGFLAKPVNADDLVSAVVAAAVVTPTT